MSEEVSFKFTVGDVEEVKKDDDEDEEELIDDFDDVEDVDDGNNTCDEEKLGVESNIKEDISFLGGGT